MDKGKTYVKSNPVLVNASSILYEGGGKTLDKLFDLVYPVGSVYMSTNSTSPETLFGGKWTKIQGKFLWATNNTPMVTGGSKTTDAHVLTVAEIPPHTHSYYGHYGYSRGAASTLGWNLNDTDYNDYHVSSTGGGQGHSHTYMPPYFEVYMWYRTA
jgi:hypothetical protein|nr:MAG TPA: baseplate protein [Caudoviricetes sp.]